jgi:CheY-like chemotaxis protein
MSDRDGSRLRPKTVMVIEDDPNCLEAVSNVLKFGGYGVVEASNGLEALRALESGQAPDLILLDLMLPVMEGSRFLHEQRTRPALAQIPVALSGERDLSRRAKELAVAGYITKPVELEDLLSTVRRLACPAASPID